MWGAERLELLWQLSLSTFWLLLHQEVSNWINPLIATQSRNFEDLVKNSSTFQSKSYIFLRVTLRIKSSKTANHFACVWSVFTMVSTNEKFTDFLRDTRYRRSYSNIMKGSAVVEQSRACCEFLKICQTEDVIPNSCKVKASSVQRDCHLEETKSYGSFQERVRVGNQSWGSGLNFFGDFCHLQRD